MAGAPNACPSIVATIMPPGASFAEINRSRTEGLPRLTAVRSCAVDDEIHELMNLSIDKNMIDKDEYPQTAKIEARCVRMLADLWHSPHPEGTLG